MLWYALVKLAMPQVVYDVLLKEGNIVMTLTEHVETCLISIKPLKCVL